MGLSIGTARNLGNIFLDVMETNLYLFPFMTLDSIVVPHLRHQVSVSSSVMSSIIRFIL